MTRCRTDSYCTRRVSNTLVHGEFPNYKVGHSSYNVDLEKKEITVSLSAYEYRSSYCVQILTPFTESIKVGVLPAGQYSVNVEGTDLKEPLMIARSIVSSPDSFLYAQITNASLKNIRGLQGDVLQKLRLKVSIHILS